MSYLTPCLVSLEWSTHWVKAMVCVKALHKVNLWLYIAAMLWETHLLFLKVRFISNTNGKVFIKNSRTERGEGKRQWNKEPEGQIRIIMTVRNETVQTSSVWTFLSSAPFPDSPQTAPHNDYVLWAFKLLRDNHPPTHHVHTYPSCP